MEKKLNKKHLACMIEISQIRQKSNNVFKMSYSQYQVLEFLELIIINKNKNGFFCWAFFTLIGKNVKKNIEIKEKLEQSSCDEISFFKMTR